SAYSASKHAVIGLTRSLAEEYRHKNITVNAVCPGYTETGMMEQAISNIKRRTGMSEPQVRQELAKNNREGRLLAPGEVADAVLALCEETATGRCVVLPGGEIC
ncbi:MAG: SDR family oxidoreductase, partial [Candidatus Eremiobacteraeota bacterium]|nr:SDR family oxidoreductase [Candidatus Eremiobacteraeota bacterium]